MNAREYLEILHVAESLKDTPRHCTTTNGRTESVAEHSWRVSLMASLLRHEFPDLDMDKVINMSRSIRYSSLNFCGSYSVKVTASLLSKDGLVFAFLR